MMYQYKQNQYNSINSLKNFKLKYISKSTENIQEYSRHILK